MSIEGNGSSYKVDKCDATLFCDTQRVGENGRAAQIVLCNRNNNNEINRQIKKKWMGKKLREN